MIIETCQFGWINISYIYEVDIILMTFVNKKKHLHLNMHNLALHDAPWSSLNNIALVTINYVKKRLKLGPCS
jgi:hypothetical protein